jgi:hypothetical protein
LFGREFMSARESDGIRESLERLYIQPDYAKVSIQVVVIQQVRVAVDVKAREFLAFRILCRNVGGHVRPNE